MSLVLGYKPPDKNPHAKNLLDKIPKICLLKFYLLEKRTTISTDIDEPLLETGFCPGVYVPIPFSISKNYFQAIFSQLTKRRIEL